MRRQLFKLQAKAPDTYRNTLRVTMFVEASGPLWAKGFPEAECTTALILKLQSPQSEK
jgi:hypothetical protein